MTPNPVVLDYFLSLPGPRWLIREIHIGEDSPKPGAHEYMYVGLQSLVRNIHTPTFVKGSRVARDITRHNTPGLPVTSGRAISRICIQSHPWSFYGNPQNSFAGITLPSNQSRQIPRSIAPHLRKCPCASFASNELSAANIQVSLQMALTVDQRSGVELLWPPDRAWSD